MKIQKADDVTAQEMTQDCDGVRMRMLVGRDDGAPHFAMRQFEVNPGGHTPHHNHAWEHECYILAGEGVIVDGKGNENPIRPGDCLFIPGDEMHQFRNTSDQPLRFLCMVPHQQQCGG
jgi:quercetin dioxygenase-like cupin family protein